MSWVLLSLGAYAQELVSIQAASGSRDVPVPAGLTLSPCFGLAPSEPGAQVGLELEFRRGKLALVTRTAVDSSLQPLSTCFEHQLAAVQWPIRHGKLAVSIQLPPSPPRVTQ